MVEEITKENKTDNNIGASEQEKSSVPAKEASGDNKKNAHERGMKRPRERHRRMTRRSSKPRSEFDQKIISIRRVTRVVAGGRRFSFSVAIVIGNKKGSVGVGIGKASDTSLAIDKAIRNAKRNIIKVHLSKDMRIRHDISAKYCSSEVVIIPAPGRGLAAGSSARNVLELAGIKDVTAKILSRSKNKLNNARATIKALSVLSP
jgi:small subunit ribosomal protein S5